MHFAKNHNKEGLKKMQASKALVKPQAIKPNTPKGPSLKLNPLDLSITPSLGNGFKATWPRVRGSAN
jgi:large subunit ribosomal protein L29e